MQKTWSYKNYEIKEGLKRDRPVGNGATCYDGIVRSQDYGDIRKLVNNLTLTKEVGVSILANSMMSLFKTYAGIDYSGAKTPTSRLKGLRVFKATFNSEPMKIKSPAERNGIGQERNYFNPPLADDEREIAKLESWSF
jgi:hypothetical protein